MRIPVKIQLQASENASTCLNIVFSSYGLHLSSYEISQHLLSSRRLNTLELIEKTSTYYNCKCDIINCSFGELKNMYVGVPRSKLIPIIARMKNGTLCVVKRFSKKHIYYNDTLFGACKCKHSDFESKFSNTILIISPNDNFQTNEKSENIAKKIINRLDKYKTIMLIIATTGLIVSLLGISFLAWQRYAIDTLMDGKDPD